MESWRTRISGITDPMIDGTMEKWSERITESLRSRELFFYY